jgi:hypothetical protein
MEKLVCFQSHGSLMWLRKRMPLISLKNKQSNSAMYYYRDAQSVLYVRVKVLYTRLKASDVNLEILNIM